MGFLSMLFISLGTMIGSGWLFTALAASAATGPASIISWFVGGVVVILIALSFAELTGMVPRSGAVVRYPLFTHGGLAAFLLGWAYLVGYATGPAIEAEAVLTYAQTYLKGLGLFTTRDGVQVLSWPAGILLAVALIAVFFVINYFGIRLLSRLNNVITIWKLLIPAATFILVFALSFHASNFSAFGFAPDGAKGALSAVASSGVLFSLLGFRQALEFGGEGRRAARDAPKVTIAAVLIALAIYALLQVAFIGAINWSAVRVGPGHWSSLATSTLAASPFYSVLKATGVGALAAFAPLLLADAVVSPGGSGYLNLGSTARNGYGMSINGFLPAVAQRMNRFHIPVVPLVGGAVVSCLFILPFPSWYLMVSFSSVTVVLTYVIGGISLRVFRREAPDLPRSFRLWGSPVLAPLSVIASVLVIYWSGFTSLINVIAVVFLGLPLFLCYYASRRDWLTARVAYPVGGAFLVAWIVTQVWGGWVMEPATTPISSHPAFPAYFAVMVAEVVLCTAVLWLPGNRDARTAVRAGVWFEFLAFATLLVSYYGGFGPLTHPPIPFPEDTAVVAVIALASYAWSVAVGYRTAELEDLLTSARAESALTR
jgi:amino acid transporter